MARYTQSSHIPYWRCSWFSQQLKLRELLFRMFSVSVSMIHRTDNVCLCQLSLSVLVGMISQLLPCSDEWLVFARITFRSLSDRAILYWKAKKTLFTKAINSLKLDRNSESYIDSAGRRFWESSACVVSEAGGAKRWARCLCRGLVALRRIGNEIPDNSEIYIHFCVHLPLPTPVLTIINYK